MSSLATCDFKNKETEIIERDSSTRHIHVAFDVEDVERNTPRSIFEKGGGSEPNMVRRKCAAATV